MYELTDAHEVIMKVVIFLCVLCTQVCLSVRIFNPRKNITTCQNARITMCLQPRPQLTSYSNNEPSHLVAMQRATHWVLSNTYSWAVQLQFMFNVYVAVSKVCKKQERERKQRRKEKSTDKRTERNRWGCVLMVRQTWNKVEKEAY
jgi:hypothetical protein